MGERLFIEKRDANLSILWSSGLHQRSGIASIKGRLLETDGHIALVGANDDRLLLHRLGQDGKWIQTSVDSKISIGNPLLRTFSVHAFGDSIYIRGKADLLKNPPLRITEFCFSQTPGP